MSKHAIIFVVLLTSQISASDLVIKSSVKTQHVNQVAYGKYDIQSGSGTVIKKDKNKFYVLSCCHIAEHNGKVGTGTLSIITWEKKSYPAKIISYDKERDLSLIEVDSSSEVRVAKIAEKDNHTPGDKIVKSGYTWGGNLKMASGVYRNIKSFSERDSSIVSFVSDAYSRSGDSGGGVFREKDLSLVGVIWGGKEDGLRAMNLENIRKFLSKSNFKLD